MELDTKRLIDEKIKKEFRSNFVTQLTTLVIGAFTLVAALAWNEAIKLWLDRFIKSGKGAIPMTIYALIITLVAVLAAMFLNWMSNRLNK